ncbi:type IV pilus assembly PilZ [Magnetococcus marinus MC-1]|uniref:Type IV pilus assembly PilZ n=1 Tax=Magnetococcus marinus (strain ATCC BAA-1437 / JCM 17883 / MC-1) TaxID=156889 RepID=A0LCN1_MAGMM|nr:PilZ domain-containing protein [Magnetococcus marinus]ABK45724.1 type IV pilus assembly PilZ [Magnetococcus marinus MC-1]
MLPSSDNRRKLTRLPMHLQGELQLTQAPPVRVRVENMSFSGAGVYCDHAPATWPNKALRLQLTLNPEDEQFDIHLHASLVYAHKDGRLGLHLTGIEADSYTHFEKLMLHHCDHADDLLQELALCPGLEPGENGRFAPITEEDR